MLADGKTEYCAIETKLNMNDSRWKYFTYRERALEDFDYIRLGFFQHTQANNLYITNVSFYKETTSGDCNYDENGNLVSISNQSKEEGKFKYDNNNQLIKSTNTKGRESKYEYDNNKQNRLLNSISSSSISNEIKYDSKGNPITTRISKKYVKELQNGNYVIRSKGTDKYLKAELNSVLLESNKCSNTVWSLEKIEENYKFSYVIIPNFSIAYSNDKILLSDTNNNNLFTLEENENGSYYIKVIIENTTKYLKVKDSCIVLEELDINNPAFEFYIELADEMFIENSATYTEDGKFIKSVTDSNFNTTIYEIDDSTGLLKSVTDPKKLVISYTYDNKHQLINVKTKEKEIIYDYNDKNLLSKIREGNKEYNFLYDDFLNINKVMIGDNITLITNNYEEENGKLLKSTYGNGQILSYLYDEFDRIKTLTKMDDSYHYKYNSNGNVAKIISNNYNEKYTYDVSNRICEYIYNNFKINYTYDSNNSVYKLNNIIHNLENTFNSDEYLIKVVLDNKEINYTYDSLGRIINKNI